MKLKRKKRRLLPGVRVKKYVDGGKIPDIPKFDIKVDREKLQKGVMAVESLNGILMKNPQSSATGLYGQLFGFIGIGLWCWVSVIWRDRKH